MIDLAKSSDSKTFDRRVSNNNQETKAAKQRMRIVAYVSRPRLGTTCQNVGEITNRIGSSEGLSGQKAEAKCLLYSQP